MKRNLIIVISLIQLNIFSNEFFVQDTVFQGAPITFIIDKTQGNIDYEFSLYNSNGNKVIELQGFNYYLYENKSTIILGLGGIPVDLPKGIYKAKAQGYGPHITYFFEQQVEVKEIEYSSAVLNANPTMESIATGEIDQERVDQSKRLWEAFNQFSKYILYHEDSVVKPVNGRHSSPFGYTRITKYPKGKESKTIHYGEDLAVPTGTPVHSCGSGRVILAENRIVSGNSVVIEHLPGVVSVYYHLDSFGVKKGDILKTGDIIGYAGSTGFSTGPHVHWELRMASIPVNPMTFLTRPLIDKILILNIINSNK